MKSEDKKPILSKRVIICLVVASFLIIAAIFIAIISIENGISSTGSFDEPINEENASETEENGGEIIGDLFSDRMLGIPIFIWMIIVAFLALRIFYGGQRFFSRI